MSCSALKDKLAGASIHLWGAGRWGRVLRRRLAILGLEPAGFLDSNAANLPSEILGLPVEAPEPFLAAHARKAAGPTEHLSAMPQPASGSGGESGPQGGRDVLVITPQFFREAMLPLAEKAGFVRGENLFLAEDFTPHHYVVEISGRCNLRCPACPRGRKQPFENRDGGQMSLDAFRLVAAKIKAEDPMAANLQLYQWGEPLLNPDLPAMIELARDNELPVSISSNLNVERDLEPVIAAGPDWFRASLSGCGPDYEKTHAGGKWARVRRQMDRLAELKRRHNSAMRVEVYYHLYRHNQGDEIKEALALCRDLGFEFQPVWGYLISLDEMMGAALGRPLPDEAEKISELLAIDYQKALAEARRERHKPCLVDKAVMVDWDLSAPVCMMFYYRRQNVLAENFLETPLGELMRRREESELCARCCRLGLHRYCDFYYNYPINMDQFGNIHAKRPAYK
ncbi:radical SAM protein [Deltaproteobacteria bacterium OttesenSCG-928-K17]|nr:radical SAM protein [Deltaproteobacteria bacterium OttesenSCG-928-K17]